MNYSTIIFDFDGVLFDSEKTHLQACNEVFQTLGFIVPEVEYFERYVGLPDNEMFELILNGKNIPHTAEQSLTLRQNKIKAYQNIIYQSKSLEGVHNVKFFLKNYSTIIHQFAICSSATREEIDTTLDKLDNGQLKAYFKHIISIDDVNNGKPSPEGYLLAAKRLGVQPQECLVIEDTPVGITAAKNAGMDVIALTTSHNKSVLKNANYIANNYDEISTWLNTI
jgi:beta-phosphoglucomutase